MESAALDTLNWTGSDSNITSENGNGTVNRNCKLSCITANYIIATKCNNRGSCLQSAAELLAIPIGIKRITTCAECENPLKLFNEMATMIGEEVKRDIPTTSITSTTQIANGTLNFDDSVETGAERYEFCGEACANLTTTNHYKLNKQTLALAGLQIFLIPSPTPSASSIADTCTQSLRRRVSGNPTKFQPEHEQDFANSQIGKEFKKRRTRSSHVHQHRAERAEKYTFIGCEKSVIDGKSHHQVKTSAFSEDCVNNHCDFIYLCNLHDWKRLRVDILKFVATKLPKILFDLTAGRSCTSKSPARANAVQKDSQSENIQNAAIRRCVNILQNLSSDFDAIKSRQLLFLDGISIVFIESVFNIVNEKLYFRAEGKKLINERDHAFYPIRKLVQGYIKDNCERSNTKDNGSRLSSAGNQAATPLKIGDFVASQRLKRLQQHFRSRLRLSRRNFQHFIKIYESFLESSEGAASAELVALLLPQNQNKFSGAEVVKRLPKGSIAFLLKQLCNNLKDVLKCEVSLAPSSAVASISIWSGCEREKERETEEQQQQQQQQKEKSFKNPKLSASLENNSSSDGKTFLTTKLVRLSIKKPEKKPRNTSEISAKEQPTLIKKLDINKQKSWLRLNTEKEEIKQLKNDEAKHTSFNQLAAAVIDSSSPPSKRKSCRKSPQPTENATEVLQSSHTAESATTRTPVEGESVPTAVEVVQRSLKAPFSEFDARNLSEFLTLHPAQLSEVYQNFETLDSRDDSTIAAAFKCYDELLDENSSDCSCEDCIEQQKLSASVKKLSAFEKCSTNRSPSQQTTETESKKMREANSGQLRGLLKKPNQPPPTRKNRVVFDETRNEFFEADYIILIREDCSYDEEDEEPCACGEHELVRLCCEEGCQCNNYTLIEDNRTPQSPKFAPPMEFVDEAALSPPDGYKDNGVKATLGGSLSGHIFGAQHIQQLQVIQRLQQQRAAMLASRSSGNNHVPQQPPPAENLPKSEQQQQQHQEYQKQQHLYSKTTANNHKINAAQPQQPLPADDPQTVCTECAECAECAAKQLQEVECAPSQRRSDEIVQLGIPAVTLLPMHSNSPERRTTQKEIIAGEERPKYLIQAQLAPLPERRNIREATEDVTVPPTAVPVKTDELVPPVLPAKPVAMSMNQPNSVTKSYEEEKPPPIPPKESSPTQISGILKGGKLWKQDSISQSDDQSNTTSDDEANSAKRSVRFTTEVAGNTEGDGSLRNASGAAEGDAQINELIPIKKHSTLFNNALRPNSAVRQLFPSVVQQSPVLTSEILRAFDESKRTGCLVPMLPGSSDSDTLRRSMERNILRRSLTKKKTVKSDISLEERIKQLTCDIDELRDGESGSDSTGKTTEDNELPSSGTLGEVEGPEKCLNGIDKSFSPSSSVSSSSSGSSSAYKKISEIFSRDKKQDKIVEMEENPIVIIPQECRCPAAPDLGMGIQVPVVHTQIHRPPPRQPEPKKQFLSTLAPLTACVAGQKDDLSSYYTLAAAHRSGYTANTSNCTEYNFGSMDQSSTQITEETRKVAPDVIAGTPGQEQQQDELAVFAQQEAIRTEKIKKRYTNEMCNIDSDDDEQNDYGFNKRPSVRGIKPKFSSTNDILQQMQNQLTQHMPSLSTGQTNNQAIKSYTMPKQTVSSAMNLMAKHASLNASSQNMSQSGLLSEQQASLPNQQNLHQQHNPDAEQVPQQHQQQFLQPQPYQQMAMQANTIAQQQTEQRTWSFCSEVGEPHISLENSIQQPDCYQTLPPNALFRQGMMHHGQEEAFTNTQNCRNMTIMEQQQYGHYVRSPTRRPESPPPLRNYHQTMVLIPYNAETYSQFATASVDPKMAHIPRQNILEYQQVTQQTIRVPIGYALPGMQLHVVAGRGQSTTHYAHAQHPHQRNVIPHFAYTQEAGLGERRAGPEGAAVMAHSDCSHMVSPTGSGGHQQAQQMQQQFPPNCNQSTAIGQEAPTSACYSMNV